MAFYCSIRNYINIFPKPKTINLLTKCEWSCYINKENCFFASKKILHSFPDQLNIERTSFGAGKQVQSVYKNLHRSYAKRRKAEQSGAESSDEDDDSIDKYDKNCKVIRSNMTSLRLDAILKAGLGLSRNKVDTAFYESKIRINGEKVLKKSQRIDIGDEIDLVKGLSPVNPDVLNVSRVEVISAKPDDDEEKIIVKMKRFKSLQIENYEKVPYVQESSAES